MFEKILLLVLVAVCVEVSCEDGPVVKINQGQLRGTVWKTKKGRDFNVFMSIPYAKPPVEKLRFAPPVPGDPWKGIRYATQIHNVCPQRDIYLRLKTIMGDEDCLYLNVYAPKFVDADNPLPVMVYIHGGGFLCGGGNSFWLGPQILMDKNIVLVSVNYRLGALGFLSTGDAVSPGNNGLKDQTLALKWVQENIKHFGGNPESVTIFGNSAGGASCHFHLLSRKSAGLFHAAISQSATVLNLWTTAPEGEGVRNSKKLARILKCPDDNTKKMVNCLRKIDASTIVSQDVHFMEWDTDPMIPFKPTVEPDLEGAFLMKHPIDIIKSGNYSKVPWMTGMTSADGALRASVILAIPHLFEELNDDFEKLLPISLGYKASAKDDKDVDYITKQIKTFYFKDKKVDNRALGNPLIDVYSDIWFSPHDAIRLHMAAGGHPIYCYLFGHRGVFSFTEMFSGDKDRDYGVCHADELQYLFPYHDLIFPDRKQSEQDLMVTDLITSLWSNFAKYRDPTPAENDLIKERWEPVQSKKMEYYYIAFNNSRMEKGLFLERNEFLSTLPIRSTWAPAVKKKDEL